MKSALVDYSKREQLIAFKFNCIKNESYPCYICRYHCFTQITLRVINEPDQNKWESITELLRQLPALNVFKFKLHSKIYNQNIKSGLRRYRRQNSASWNVPESGLFWTEVILQTLYLILDQLEVLKQKQQTHNGHLYRNKKNSQL